MHCVCGHMRKSTTLVIDGIANTRGAKEGERKESSE